MHKEIKTVGQTMVDPEKVKYYLKANRWITSRTINGKNWYRSHLVYAYYHYLTLETLQMFLNWGFCIHHRDGNPQNDVMENFRLLTHGNHISLHQNESLCHLYRQDLKTDQIIELVIDQKFSTTEAGKFLNANNSTIGHRLRKAGYKNFGSERRPYWGKEGDGNIKYHRIKDKQILDLIINQRLSACKVAKILKIGDDTVRRRLHKLGYKNFALKGSKFPIWGKKEEKC